MISPPLRRLVVSRVWAEVQESSGYSRRAATSRTTPTATRPTQPMIIHLVIGHSGPCRGWRRKGLRHALNDAPLRRGWLLVAEPGFVLLLSAKLLV